MTRTPEDVSGAAGISPHEGEQTQFRYSRTIDATDSSLPVTKEALGGKGFGLVEMARLGLSVPPGFILTTGAWCEYHASDDRMPSDTDVEITRQLHRLEEKTGKKLGDPINPLFVSARSGGEASMPGVLETKLNIGINSTTVNALSQEIGEQAARESYRSLIASFEAAGYALPENPREQLNAAIALVYRSWLSPKATLYREEHHISETAGIAVTVQQMVWGNSVKESAGAGVLLTRDPMKFSDEPVIVFSPHAQGTEVVSDAATAPQVPLSHFSHPRQEELRRIATLLHEYHRRIPQDIEFTDDGNSIWILQTRELPLSNLALFRSLVEQTNDGLTTNEALRVISAQQLESLLEPALDPQAVTQAIAEGRLIDHGIPVSIGVRSGRIVSSREEALQYPDENVVLASSDFTRDSIDLPKNVTAILVTNGSIGSHIARTATVLANKQDVVILFGIHLEKLEPGDRVTVDSHSGSVFRGDIPRLVNGSRGALTHDEEILVRAWLDEYKQNPWRFLVSEDIYEQYRVLAHEAIGSAREQFRSLKAREYAVFNSIIPEKIRMEYATVKPHEEDRIRQLFTTILSDPKYESTIRTCHDPDLPAGGPWARLTSLSDIDRFFSDPSYSKYGGYKEFLQKDNGELTEFLIGRIPKDKMSPDETLRYQHCAWTLSCTPDEIVLQVRPFSPHIRSHEDESEEGLISFFVRLEPPDGAHGVQAHVYRTEIGERLQDNLFAHALADYVRDTVLGPWWKTHALPSRMAAIADAFKDISSAPPVFEGQARITPDGSTWCLAYGIKTK